MPGRGDFISFLERLEKEGKFWSRLRSESLKILFDRMARFICLEIACQLHVRTTQSSRRVPRAIVIILLKGLKH
jgi:hypothetical protein